MGFPGKEHWSGLLPRDLPRQLDLDLLPWQVGPLLLSHPGKPPWTVCRELEFIPETRIG